MTPTQIRISELEEKLKQADLKSDPVLLNDLIADDALFTGQDGKLFGKQEVITAHHPIGEEKFTRFDVSDLKIHDHGSTAIVTLLVDLAGKDFAASLRFTRVWVKRDSRWQIVAGHISAVSN